LIDHAHAITKKGVVSSKLVIGLRRVRGHILGREDGEDKRNRDGIVFSDRTLVISTFIGKAPLDSNY